MKKADNWFSKWVRIFHADKMGIVKCITCEKTGWWENFDAGHFMTRNHQSTRYHRKNCQPQCRKCNSFLGGRQHEHGLAIDEMYGDGTAEMLLIESKKLCKRGHIDFEMIADEFREEFNELNKALESRVNDLVQKAIKDSKQ